MIELKTLDTFSCSHALMISSKFNFRVFFHLNPPNLPHRHFRLRFCGKKLVCLSNVFQILAKTIFFYNGQLPLKPLANRLLPSWQVVKCPLHSKFSIQVLSLEPCSTNPYWQEKRTVFPTLKSPNRSPLSGLPGSGHSFSAKRICESMLRDKTEI